MSGERGIYYTMICIDMHILPSIASVGELFAPGTPLAVPLL